MARQWNLPGDFAALIEQHTAIDKLLDAGPVEPLTAAVRLSSLLPATSDELWFEAARFEQAFDKLLASRRSDGDRIPDQPGRGIQRLRPGAERQRAAQVAGRLVRRVDRRGSLAAC